MTASRTDSVASRAADPTGLHRVLDDAVVLPQAAERLDNRRELWPDEVRVRVETLNLDAASFRQLEGKHTVDGRTDGDAVRREVLDIVATRGKMQNPVTGSGGMLIGTVEEVGPESTLGLHEGDHVATLVSLTLTPLMIEDGLERWDGLSEQVPADGYAVLFGRSIAATIPDDLPPALSLAVMDVCGAPALTARVVAQWSRLRSTTENARSTTENARSTTENARSTTEHAGSTTENARSTTEHAGSTTENAGSTTENAGSTTEHAGSTTEHAGSTTEGPVVAVIGGAGKSGSLSLAAARRAGCRRTVGVVPNDAEAALLRASGLADDVVVADARDPIALRDAVAATGGAADITVVCVDVPGCEGGAILATAPGGTVVFFSMATSFPAAALGAEGLAADVTMLVGNGYTPGHAAYALELLRADAGVRSLFERRL
ncbi:L-erythro-3,5-diaminohexanoate dehydrogenase [Nocardioides cynanchi]|uniref:L-erythro-3,5-diaminohexanoate dehydrogenase n=1 Tax=Nocardioides cynanchi TaxID=2558918 RepID=UPI001EE2FBC0|nr:L-erythro-3,5-diaminohexanoate dehydrogenase [Nocardioides cynanchi]